MSSLLEQVARARDRRREAEVAFREALRRAKEHHSWAELAAVSGLTADGARYLARNLNARRQERRRAS